MALRAKLELQPVLLPTAYRRKVGRAMTKTFGPPERRECHGCGIVRTLEFFHALDVLCDDCRAREVEQDWGGDHIADTNQERTL